MSPRLTKLPLSLLLLMFACGGHTSALNDGSNEADYAGAAVTATAAAAMWVAGGGCKLQGCPYGSYCNEKSGYCDVKKCSEGCPVGTVCNEGLDRCQVAPPPQVPSDQLPQDDARNFPTQH
jgi:hypothetical protein